MNQNAKSIFGKFMDIKYVPAWIFSTAFLALVLLMVVSYFRDKPFYINGSPWGFGIVNLQIIQASNFTKICSAHTREWVDTILVPDSWTVATCKSWGEKWPGYTGTHLGCVLEDSVSYSTKDTVSPSPNCGW